MFIAGLRAKLATPLSAILRVFVVDLLKRFPPLLSESTSVASIRLCRGK
jgi:hypothetical protein